MTEDQAQVLALKALGWMGGQDEILSGFLGASGMDVDSLKQSAGQSETLLAILDYLLSQDAWVSDFCKDEGVDSDAPMMARAALPGGAEMHWT